jgi:hypothetical protein
VAPFIRELKRRISLSVVMQDNTPLQCRRSESTLEVTKKVSTTTRHTHLCHMPRSRPRRKTRKRFLKFNLFLASLTTLPDTDSIGKWTNSQFLLTYLVLKFVLHSHVTRYSDVGAQLLHILIISYTFSNFSSSLSGP